MSNKEFSKRDEEFPSIYPTSHPSTKNKECFSINIWAMIGFQVLTTVLFKVGILYFFFLGGGLVILRGKALFQACSLHLQDE